MKGKSSDQLGHSLAHNSRTHEIFRRNTAERNRYSCVDKAKNSIIESYLTTQPLISIKDVIVPVAGSDASGNATSQTAQFAHRLVFLLSFAGALRGESTRTIE